MDRVAPPPMVTLLTLVLRADHFPSKAIAPQRTTRNIYSGYGPHIQEKRRHAWSRPNRSLFEGHSQPISISAIGIHLSGACEVNVSIWEVKAIATGEMTTIHKPF